ncbi:thioredoxin domain-containing protein 17 [Biomphalaria glabrata]|uniref:Thioredoxin domain-containing protein 17 n=1 Tax=Biomphalaria glabrata TaxID=6526 RepID=A0A2C9JGS1_BIOGL|nr:thioredoxin domain-containing protein 17-like [Biomphalaria glabrata]KAI8753446.1 thioredoxin domain-containing protein 17-like [Biomphalaria glabrata]KAI8783255.1 thioredoxin domain-containing protein 17 [Biomphalaria glabrata]
MNMVRTISVHGYEALTKALSGIQGSVYILFSGSQDEYGVSWCPDCVKAEPVINKNLEKAPSDATFIHCHVGDRNYWKKQDNEFRKDPKFLVKCVPTLLKFGSPQRLEEEQLFKDDLIQMMFEED